METLITLDAVRAAAAEVVKQHPKGRNPDCVYSKIDTLRDEVVPVCLVGRIGAHLGLDFESWNNDKQVGEDRSFYMRLFDDEALDWLTEAQYTADSYRLIEPWGAARQYPLWTEAIVDADVAVGA